MCGYLDTGDSDINHDIHSHGYIDYKTRCPTFSATSTSSQRAITSLEHLVGFLYSQSIRDTPSTIAEGCQIVVFYVWFLSILIVYGAHVVCISITTTVGGGVLEIYLVIRSCTGLDRNCFHLISISRRLLALQVLYSIYTRSRGSVTRYPNSLLSDRSAAIVMPSRPRSAAAWTTCRSRRCGTCGSPRSMMCTTVGTLQCRATLHHHRSTSMRRRRRPRTSRP